MDMPEEMKTRWVNTANDLIEWLKPRFETPEEAALFLGFINDTFKNKCLDVKAAADWDNEESIQ